MIRCPNCGAKHDDSVATCDCGQSLAGVVPEERKRSAASPPSHSASTQGGDGTGALVVFLRIVAAVTLAGGVAVAYFSSAVLGWTAVGYFVFGLVAALLLLAVASHLEITAQIAESIRAMRRDLQSLQDGR